MTISPISCTKSACACSAAMHLPFFPFIHSFGDSPDNSSSSSSIVFQSQSQAEADAASSVKGPASEAHPMTAIVSSKEGQAVCPRTMRRIPENYVPCVFLGQREPKNGSKRCAMGWDTSALLDEESSIELNNNFYIDKECQQWADKCSRRPSKEVSPQLVTKQNKTNVILLNFL